MQLLPKPGEAARDLGRMMCVAVFENMWFRQLIDFYRLAGVYDIARRKQGWGAMRRTGFNESSGTRAGRTGPLRTDR